MSEGCFMVGMKMGYWTFWDENGNIESEGYYNENEKVSKWKYKNSSDSGYYYEKHKPYTPPYMNE